ncbi:MAG: 4-oxalocrotonate tautomerase [Actinomycetota bacterium]|nr:4-oxalocrotonate tautomerase [Actinomycetota bacterium]
MPIITVKVIKGVVLTSDEQKRDLLAKMTDAFISVVGDVARPYTYCLIEETPLFEWSIGGVPLPDLPFLYGPDYAEMHAKANALMKAYVESTSTDGDGGGGGNGSGSAEPADPLASQTPGLGDEAAQSQWATGS